ncbi:hypothetical protein HYU12_03890 [Candidatus Woesearchaeota archaeon]|nr:hypothetical protein [Candidatus Woesearchaeota archaeon]
MAKESKKKPENYAIIIYWTTLLTLTITNIFAAVAITFLAIFTTTAVFNLFLTAIAILFGYVFSLLITKIENLSTHHHLAAIILVPSFSIISILATSSSAPKIAKAFGIATSFEPETAAITYAIAFTAPYLITLYLKERH